MPEQFHRSLRPVLERGETHCLKIDTPDLVHTTHELVDHLERACPGGKPALYVVREDRLSEYDWQRGDWNPPQQLPLERSLEVVENSRAAFCVFVFWNIERLLDDREGQPSVRNFIPQLMLSPRAVKKLLVFLEPLGTRYPSVVAPYLLSATVPYPSKDELRPLVRRQPARFGVDIAGREEDLVGALLGLTYSTAQETLHVCLCELAGCGPEGLDALIGRLNREKERILAETLGMTILRPGEDAVPYGLDYLLEDFAVHRHLICTEGQRREKGWLLIGPPGTGKTMVAGYLAAQLGYPAISFQISSVMNSLVGQTEKNMYAMCRILETFAPCVLYIDEFEKALSTGGELDGGTMMRAMGILFSFLNDTGAPLFVLGSANNLDPQHGLALTRKGRFSQLYWVDLPCCRARHDIARSAFARHGAAVPEDLVAPLAEQSAGFSGADLAWLCRETLVRARYHGYPPESEDFGGLIDRLVAENRARVEIMRAQYDPLRRWGKAYCRPAGPPPEE